jgi:hypothetical protein
LTRALGIVHDEASAVAADDAFDDLVRRSDLDAATTSALLDRDVRAMDRLVQSLNELRGLA